MKRYLLAAAVGFSLTAPAMGADICTAVNRQGHQLRAVTALEVNPVTGGAAICSHGGGCVPAGSVQALTYRLTNCTFDFSQPHRLDADTLTYSAVVNRSANPPEALKMDDVEDRLIELGFCSACAGNLAYRYVKTPQSYCARLVRQTLEGNPTTLAMLEDASCEGNIPGRVPH